MSITTRSRRWHAEIATRLQGGDPVALIELYDATSAVVYAYALQAATSWEDACRATRDAYLTVWQAPQILDDVRVPVEVRLASLVRSARQRLLRPSRSKLAHARPDGLGQGVGVASSSAREHAAWVADSMAAVRTLGD